jgi:hypothetical protein
MSKYSCQYCEKEYSRKDHLLKHEDKCDDRVLKPVEVPVEPKVDLDKQRQIKKLKDAHKSCMDAETKYRYECMIKELENE